MAAALLLLVSTIGYVISPYVGYRALGSVYLVTILIISTITTAGPILFTALISAFIWNFVFIPPRFTFAISSTEDVIMLVSFFLAALVGGVLTSRIRRQEIIQVSNTLHQTLLNSLSHELRTPLTTLIGSASALKDEKTYQDAAARTSLIDELIRSSSRLNRVVENLLDVSRLNKNILQLKREWFDVADIYDFVEKELHTELKNHKIVFEYKDTLLVHGDFHLLSQALLQIIYNAVKYSPSESTIKVLITKESSWIKLNVSDEGPGLPIGLETKIFEKFYRLPGTAAGGLGLGLAIANDIIVLHGGSIIAKNRTESPGSIFEINIPLEIAPIKLQEALL